VGRSAVSGYLLGVLILGLAQSAAAQGDAAGQLGVGYSFLANDDLAVNQRNLTWGFSVDSAFKLTNQISLAGEVNGHFKRGIEPSDSRDRVVAPLPSQDFQALSFNRPETGFCSPTLASLNECSVSVQTISGVAGPRLYVPVGRARPFVHVMVGATRSLRTIDFFAHTSTNFTLQGGAGFEVDMTPRVSLRIQGDYRRVFFGVPDQSNPGASLVSKDGADFNEVMVSVGVGFKLGNRQ
jgi:opacity protein-like surface antigen